LHVDHPGTRPHPKSGHKKPGLNTGSAGITSVPGLFSELFNVAASRPAQMTTEHLKLVPGRLFVKAGLRLPQARTAERRPDLQGFSLLSAAVLPNQ
jgi:hypothetical protein